MTLPLLLLLACNKDKTDTGPSSETPPPFGMILQEDGQLYAGAARVDITPTGFETYSDLNGNNEFDGCWNAPNADRSGCDEPFEDLDGDNYFDAIYIAGFQTNRPAQDVHDPLTVSAVVMSLNGEYVALVGVDAVGVLESRVRKARNALAADGFDMDRVLVSASHTHAGGDTVGIWGDIDNLISGVNPDFTESISNAIYDAVATAASSMEAVSPSYGAVHLSDYDPAFSGVPFGGTNPDTWMIGTINDIRDPLIAADQLLTIALDGPSGRMATVVNFAAHPESSGSDHSSLSADYVGYLRDHLEANAGGTTVFLSGTLGGMQSALSGTLPLVDENGDRAVDENGASLYITESQVINEQGEQLYVTESTWEFVRAQGYLLAQAAEANHTDTAPWDAISVKTKDVMIPVSNVGYELAFRTGLLDSEDSDLVVDATCPGYPDEAYACIPAGIWMIQLGPITLGSFPGEAFPELFFGVPDETAMADQTQRFGDRRWPQWNDACTNVDFEDCRYTGDEINGCPCLSHHVSPYEISYDGVPPIQELLPGTYRAAVGIGNGYCGYIVPEPDFNHYVSALTDDGDHYEETNACSNFAPSIQAAYQELTAE